MIFVCLNQYFLHINIEVNVAHWWHFVLIKDFQYLVWLLISGNSCNHANKIIFILFRLKVDETTNLVQMKLKMNIDVEIIVSYFIKTKCGVFGGCILFCFKQSVKQIEPGLYTKPKMVIVKIMDMVDIYYFLCCLPHSFKMTMLHIHFNIN